MATVRQTLALNDRMSPVLSKIINAMHSTLNIMEQVNVASERGISAKAFADTRNQINAANTALSQTVLAIDDVNDEAIEARSGFASWQSAIVTANQGIELLKTAWQGVNKVAGFADQQTGISSRLKLLTGSAEAATELEKQIMESANRSKASYTATAQSITQMGMMAGDAFKNANGQLDYSQLIGFTESINKQLAISGVAGTAGAEAAVYQLTQAMSSGVLRGEELNSVLEQAPMIAQNIAKYLNIPMGELRKLASEGKITSEVVKEAMLAASGEMTDQFEDIPTNFGQAMTLLENKATEAAKPLTSAFSSIISTNAPGVIAGIVDWLDRMVDKLEEIGNNPGFQQFASTAGSVLSTVGVVLGWIIELALNIFDIVMWAWPVLEPMLYGVAAALLLINAPLAAQAGLWIWNSVLVPIYTAVVGFLKHGYLVLTSATYRANAAQLMYNSALLASPITWIILILIALIAVIVAVINIINLVTGSSLSAMGAIVGGLAVAGAFIWNLFLGILDLILGVFNALVNPIIAWVNFFGNVFNDPIGSVIQLFGDMADNVLGIIESIAKAMDKVFGSNMAGTVSKWRSGLDSMINTATKQYGNGAYEEVMGELNLSSESLGLGRWAYSDAYDWGYKAGVSLETSMGSIMDDVLGGFDPTASPGEPGDTPGGGFNPDDYTSGDGFNVNADGSEVSLSDDDIKYLRDIAKLEYVSQYTTLRPVVTAQFGDIHETADVNQIITVLEDAIEGAYESSLGKG